MLEHGFGVVLLVLPGDVFVLVSMLLLMLFLFISVVYWNLKRTRPFFVGTVIACGGGAFGFSTLTMIFPALALLLLSSVTYLYWKLVKFQDEPREIRYLYRLFN